MDRKGFSLIEVLVATAILVIIVGMVGMVFRQSSMSWDSGIHSADDTSKTRAVIGAMARDLRSAVDAREFGARFAKQYQKFDDSSSISFVALLEPDDEPGTRQARVPTLIVYEVGASVKRTASVLKLSSIDEDGNEEWAPTTSVTSYLLEEVRGSDINIWLDYGDDIDDFPAYVTIHADITARESLSGVKVYSMGRDGKKGTRDDIVVE